MSDKDFCDILFREMELKIRHDPLMLPLNSARKQAEDALSILTPGERPRSLIHIQEERKRLSGYECMREGKVAPIRLLLRQACSIFELLNRRHDRCVSLFGLNIPGFAKDKEILKLADTAVKDMQDIVITDCFVRPFVNRGTSLAMLKIVAQEVGIAIHPRDTIACRPGDEERIDKVAMRYPDFYAQLPPQPSFMMPYFKERTWEILNTE